MGEFFINPLHFPSFSFFISILLIFVISKFLLNLVVANRTTHKLPPGPPTIPFIGNLLWLLRPLSELNPILQTLHKKYGPIFTLRLGSRPIIFVASHSLSHEALIMNGAIFADRPPSFPTAKYLSCNQHTITSAAYGSTWLLLRRNLSSNILQPSRLKSFSCARKFVLDILISRLKSQSASNSNNIIEVKEQFNYAMFYLLAFMCFGEKLEEKQINDIKDVQRRMLLSFDKFNSINLFPKLGKILFRKRWEELYQLRREQEKVLLPLIRARQSFEDKEKCEKSFVPYIDTLYELQLPEKKRKLEEREMITLCSEFLNAGTDTTLTALEWTMANLVKYPSAQQKLFMDIKRVVGGESVMGVEESALQGIPFLKAVILESLRRHPPSHFLIPHAVTRNVVLDGVLVPKNSTVNFMVAEMGRDPTVWENPMEFHPERFLHGNENGQMVDIIKRKEINKMMPFGMGRRMCPAHDMAMLHLEYFVANLVWCFEWTTPEGVDVDLSEKHEFTTGMKNPLQIKINPRSF